MIKARTEEKKKRRTMTSANAGGEIKCVGRRLICSGQTQIMNDGHHKMFHHNMKICFLSFFKFQATQLRH